MGGFQTRGPRCLFLCSHLPRCRVSEMAVLLLFFFFLPFPERVTFMTHQVMPSLTGQSGACSLLTSHFCTWYQVHHLMETLKASRVGTSGKEAFDSFTAEICQSQGSHTFKNTLIFFLFKGICKHNFLRCEEDFAKCVQRLSQKAVFA